MLGLLLALAFTFTARDAVALPAGLTAAEARCQLVLGPATDRLGAREATCLARCDRKVRAGRIPASDCLAPYAGTTAACVATAERLAQRTMTEACRSDCPECYGGDCPTFASGAVSATGSVVSGLATDIFCGDAAGADATVGRCRLAAAAALSHVAVATGRCVVSCQQRANRGAVPDGSCTSDPIADPRASACIARVVDGASRQLTRRCAGVTGCLATALPTLVDRVRRQIEGDYRSFILCGSPGAAFL